MKLKEKEKDRIGTTLRQLQRGMKVLEENQKEIRKQVNRLEKRIDKLDY